MKDPPVREGFASSTFMGAMKGDGGEGGGELAEDIFGGLVDFVAEATVAVHYFDIKIDIATWKCMLILTYLESQRITLTSSSIGCQREPESVSTTFRDTVWEGSFLEFCCYCELLWVKIAHLELVV